MKHRVTSIVDSRTEPSARPAEILKKIEREMGWMPNLFETVARSPVVLETLWDQVQALSRMRLKSMKRTVN